MTKEDLGRLLREAREEKRMPQSHLAWRAGVSQSAISQFENGQVSPTVTTLLEIVRELGLRLVISDARPG